LRAWRPRATVATRQQGCGGEEASGHRANTAAALAVDAALAQLEETVGDREFVAELIDDYLAELPAQLAALPTASSEGDAELVHRIAHTLKSNAATFGAEALASACRELEQSARAGEPAQARELVVRVDAEAARSIPGLVAARDERSS
jgi:HPt (histidine-containing phosphotransfer) domain-containing protein